VRELRDANPEFIAVHTNNPKPFVWTKTADRILASIAPFASSTPATQGSGRYAANGDLSVALSYSELSNTPTNCTNELLGGRSKSRHVGATRTIRLAEPNARFGYRGEGWSDGAGVGWPTINADIESLFR